jgi:fructose-1,6-bisphosphatase/inositol monophosphatase family enzyme
MKTFLHAMADSVEKKVKGMVNRTDLGEDLGLGADGTSTKLVDDVAEQICIEMIKEKGNNLNILSEEAGYIDNKADRTLVMDPIDGTHNAIRGIPFYSLSLAVGRSRLSDVEFGLVRNLVSGDTYWAEKGKGAFLNDRPLKTKPLPSKDTMFSVYMGTRATKKALAVAGAPRRSRALGCASLEMCLVASGAFDVYFLNYSPSSYSMRVIDIAASTLILREAGGQVFNDTYDILDMGFDLKERANVIAVGDSRALEMLRNLEAADQME